MARKAVDVVLLPDETVMDRVIEINRQLVREHSSEIVLNRRDCLPHVSLAMGCIDEQDIDAIREALTRLAEETPVRQLTATGIETSTNAQGRKTSLLEIEKTPELQALHERTMDEMQRFFSHDVTNGAFYDDVVAETTREWVRHYPEKAAYEQFRPHITLGYGQAKPDFSFPLASAAARLALCHLGNHATCRKILTTVDLR
jgi:2'-5' RNA ligase